MLKMFYSIWAVEFNDMATSKHHPGVTYFFLHYSKYLVFQGCQIKFGKMPNTLKRIGNKPSKFRLYLHTSESSQF